jgi:DNA polymerase III alpha subunit
MSNLISIAEGVKYRLKFSFPYNTNQWVNDMNMVMENYHKHTTWSDLIQIDSATDVEEFMQVLDNYGCKSLFSGEHGYAGEWLYIYDLCKKSQDKKYREEHGLKNPLLFRFSTEAYWVKDRLKEYPNGVNEKTGEIKYARDRTNCHIVIVAKNYTAIRKLNYILSMASIDGFYGKPRIDLDLLFSLNKDDVYITSS